MIDFEYEAPDSLERAIAILSEMNGRARPLAGGTDLIDHVRTGRLAPELIVDVKKIPELNSLTTSDDGLRLGAAVPCYRIYADPAIRRNFAALVDACSIIG
ncbi:MAG: FAD binding domain-containing protein, partial [Maioricimonas sp. JB049]